MSADRPCLWTMPVGLCDTRPVTLDGIDAVELAELLAFTADALGWRGADVIRLELASSYAGGPPGSIRSPQPATGTT